MRFISFLLAEVDYFTLFSLFILFWMSVFSWAILFAKIFSFKRIEAKTQAFLTELESRNKFADLLSLAEKNPQFPAQKMFLYVGNELKKMQKAQTELSRSEALAVLEMIFDLVVTKFQKTLEKGLSFLASISNAAPFVGLFGTVTGVLHTLYGLGDQADLGIAKLAPNLSIALIATAFGLFVAIPASVGYNYLRNRARNIQLSLRETEIYIQKKVFD